MLEYLEENICFTRTKISMKQFINYFDTLLLFTIHHYYEVPPYPGTDVKG